tara:strand:+ start:279 stop:533 length:255 start_codon:yes stop_codon:yes gene_type:complete
MRETPVNTTKKSRKRAVNLSVDEDMLAQARSAGINLSQVLDEGIRRELARQRSLTWQEENREAIEHYNRRIERKGSFGDRARRF